MDNKGEEAGLCGLAGLTGAVQGVFARSWHGGYPQISLAWSFSIYSFTGKYEPVFILPLAMTGKTQDLGCL